MSDIDDRDLARAVQKIDLLLKRRQAFWETPRNIAILLGVVATIVAAVAGALGYQIGSRPQQIIVHFEQPR